MRQRGFVGSVAGLGIQSHACWPYRDAAELRSTTVEFLREGHRLGQRLTYVGNGSADRLWDDLNALGDTDALKRDGTLDVRVFDSMYPEGEPLDVEAQVALYARETDRALADGYTGLRVAADVSRLAKQDTWETLRRWEGAADRYVESHPVAALCCYDRSAVPAGLLADLACAHPVVRDTMAVPFRLFARGKGLALEGEVDYFSSAALERLLDAVGPGHDLELDLSGVDFIDHNGVLAIARHAERLSDEASHVSVRGAPPGMRRTCEILEVAL